jgi:hypothetical protein
MDNPKPLMSSSQSSQNSQKTKEEELNENIRQSIELANDIYKAVSDPKYFDTTTGQTRYEELNKRYPTFAQHYPVCLRLMAHDGKYNEKAFRRFLDKQRKDPGKGMIGFIERQADYARFLYEEEIKSRGAHINIKHAQHIWNEEYRALKKWVDKLKKDEEDAKNMYESEQSKHDEQRRDELLQFLNEQSPALMKEDPKPTLAETDELPEDQARNAASINAIAPSITDLDDANMTFEELRAAYKDMRGYFDELTQNINEMDRYIERLEQKIADEAAQAEEDMNSVIVPTEWIDNTKPNPKSAKSNKAKEAARVKEEIEKLAADLDLDVGKKKKSATTQTKTKAKTKTYKKHR